MSDITTATGDPAAAARKARRAHAMHTAAYIAAAGGATVWAYLRMVQTGIDGGLTPAVAYGAAGFLELALVGSALGARRAVLRSEPVAVYTLLTWLFSLLSGVFSGMHDLGRPDVPFYMPLLGLVAPLVAATLWHVLLTGDRHITAGLSLDDLRARRRARAAERHATRRAERKERDAERLMLAYIVRAEDVRDSLRAGANSRTVDHLMKAKRTARNKVMTVLTVEEFEARHAAWRERLTLADEHDAALFQLGHLPAVDPAPAPAQPEDEGADQPEAQENQEDATAAVRPLPRRRWNQIPEDERAELTNRMVELYNGGKTYKEIAPEVGFSEHTVGRVLRGAGVTDTAGEGIPVLAAVGRDA